MSSGFSFQGTGSTDFGLQTIDVYFFMAEDFAIYNFDQGLLVNGTAGNFGSWTHNYVNFEIRYFAGYGINIDPSGNFTDGNIGGDRFFKNFIISNNGFTGSNAASNGIHITASGGDMFDTADITSTAVGVSVVSITNSNIVGTRFTNVYSDTCTLAGWNFNGTVGVIYGAVLTSCWGAFTANGPGLVTIGNVVVGVSGLSDLSWVGGGLYENGTNGWHHTGGNNIYLRNATIARNSKTTTNTSDGVLVDTNLGDWGLQNCIIGKFGPARAWEQANGINIAAGTGTNIIITGNDLNGAGTGKSGLVNGATGLNVISDNLPRQSGYSPTQAQSLAASTGGTTVAAGGTQYCGPLPATPTIGQNDYFIGSPGIVSSFTMACSAAPGVAQTFTYTLMKNAVATSMAGTISGASSFSVVVTANPVTFGVTDSLSMRIVASAGATATQHRGSMSVQP